ncbi:MAG: SrfA family protein [Methylococcaceae bacterium]|nr:SrfA family protein [Methylococcaceae bacterium]
MGGVLLRSGDIKNYKPLGEVGTPVYKSANQLRFAIQRHLGADSAKVLAVPQSNEEGDLIDWYASEPGSVIPWTAATDDERKTAKEELVAIQRDLSETAARMQSTNDRERQVFGRLLEHVIRFPDDQHVYLVNGKPVLTFWGFVYPNESDDKDCLKVLNLTPAPAVAGPAPKPPNLEKSDRLSLRRRFNFWWLLLLIPLLIVLMLYLFRECNPEPVLPPVPVLEEKTPPSESEVNVNKGSERVEVRESGDNTTIIDDRTGSSGGTDIYSEGHNTSTIETHDAVDGEPSASGGNSGGVTPPEDQDGQNTGEENQPPKDGASDDSTDPRKSSEETEPQDNRESQKPDANAPDQVPDPSESTKNPDEGGSLKIPDDALKTGSTEFLDGEWNASSGVVDSKTGKPLDLKYDFKDGEGNLRVEQSDGSVCTGPVNAQTTAGKLNFSSTGTIRCPGGKVYKPVEVQCTPNSSGKADCVGKYDTGESFDLEMSKSKK